MSTSRYKNTKIFKDDNGMRYKGMSKDLLITESDRDTWIIWRSSYNITLLSNKYYKSPEYYWIILQANNVSLQSDLKEGQQVRIPGNLGNILNQL